MKQLLGGAQDWGEPWELWCLAVPLDEPGAMISSFTKKSRSLVASIWKPLPREDARGRLENSLGDLEAARGATRWVGPATAELRYGEEICQ